VPSPVEFRVVVQRRDDSPSIAPGFTIIVVADGMEDAIEKAEDLAWTSTGYRVMDIKPAGMASPSTGEAGQTDA
jgi:hypothetical protein